MINTAPLRRTTLHFSHIGFTDARTFITDPCHSSRRIVGSSLPYIPGRNHSTAATGPRRTREIRRVLLRLPVYREPTSSLGDTSFLDLAPYFFSPPPDCARLGRTSILT